MRARGSAVSALSGRASRATYESDPAALTGRARGTEVRAGAPGDSCRVYNVRAWSSVFFFPLTRALQLQPDHGAKADTG